MALEHLNCKEYENSFQQYNKVKSLQHNFNNQIDTFIEGTRVKLRKFLISNNIKFTEEELHMLSRYYLYWIADKKRMSEGFNVRFENYRGSIKNEKDDEIINPFENIEREIKNYILITSDEQSKKLINLDKMIDNIDTTVKDF